MELKDRFRGCLVGLATGDALGAALEFQSYGSFQPITDMVGGGFFGLPPGYWTDDTAMALCLADSLVNKKDFDPVDQLERYLRWYEDGYLSSTGDCFDIGNTTKNALVKFKKTREAYPASASPMSAGNGSLMRLCPVPMFYAGNPELAIEMAGESSKTTHIDPIAVDACRYFAGLLIGAFQGATKEELLSDCYCPYPDCWEKHPLVYEVLEVVSGTYKKRNPPEIEGSGYVVKTLEAALWAFYHTDNFKDGCLKVVNLGNDADTTGAVFGQLAGAFYGEQSIPEAWKSKVINRHLIEDYADKLFELKVR